MLITKIRIITNLRTTNTIIIMSNMNSNMNSKWHSNTHKYNYNINHISIRYYINIVPTATTIIYPIILAIFHSSSMPTNYQNKCINRHTKGKRGSRLIK